MLGRKINIDNYSIARIVKISRFILGYDIKFKKYSIIKNKPVAETIVNQQKVYKDIFTHEKYYDKFSYIDSNDTLYIDQTEELMPLSYVIKTDDNKMNKKEFLKQCREIIITLNKKELDNNQKHIIDEIEDREKVLKLENSKIMYKEEE